LRLSAWLSMPCSSLGTPSPRPSPRFLPRRRPSPRPVTTPRARMASRRQASRNQLPDLQGVGHAQSRHGRPGFSGRRQRRREHASAAGTGRRSRVGRRRHTAGPRSPSPLHLAQASPRRRHALLGRAQVQRRRSAERLGCARRSGQERQRQRHAHSPEGIGARHLSGDLARPFRRHPHHARELQLQSWGLMRALSAAPRSHG